MTFDPNTRQYADRTGARLPTSPDVVVAQDGSGDHTTITAGFAALKPGQTMLIRGGVYRETANVPANAEGTAASPTRIFGDPDDWPVISGGEPLTGFAPCTAADEPDVGPNWASIYKTQVSNTIFPNGTIGAANICEAGEQLPLVVSRAEKPDAFFLSLNSTWWTADETVTSGGIITGYRKPSLVSRFTPTQIMRATLWGITTPNKGYSCPIASVDEVTGTIVPAETTNKYENSSVRDNFALRNLLPAMEPGEYGYVDHGDGTSTVYVWPKDPANIENGIEYSARAVGLDLSYRDHLEVCNFCVRQVASTSRSTAPLLVGTATNLRVHHFSVRDCLSAGGYAMIYLPNSHDIEMHDFVLERGQGFFGIFQQGSNANAANTGSPELVRHAMRQNLHHFEISYVSSAPIRQYTLKDSIVAFGVIYACAQATHANSMNAYQGCHNLLWWGINGQNAGGYYTWQESDSIVIGFCAAAASEAPSGGARAIYSQQNTTAKPGNAHGWLGSYCLNTRGVPNPSALWYSNGLKCSDNLEMNDAWAIYNNIYHGHDADDGPVADWNHNINTGSKARGSNDLAVGAGALYADCAAGDFSYPADSPARSFAARDCSDVIDALRKRFPQFDGWDRDLQEQLIDWTKPPVGPTVDLDADLAPPLAASSSPGDEMQPAPKPEPAPEPVPVPSSVSVARALAVTVTVG